MLSQPVLTEIVSAHADQLNVNEEHANDYLKLFPELRHELSALFQVARMLHATLKPVKPRAAFRNDLRQALVSTGYNRFSEPAFAPRQLAFSPRRNWVLGAAAVGSAMSVMGVIAYVRKTRASSHSAILHTR